MFHILNDLTALDDAAEAAFEQYADASDPRNSPKFLAGCQSHAILVIDTSGSMRTCDASSAKVEATTSRIDALLHAFQHGFVSQQIAAGFGELDFFTLIRLGEEAELIAEMEPMESGLARVPKTIIPKQQGNYIPALQCVEQVVSTLEGHRQQHPTVAAAGMCTHVLFMSDGKPSDSLRTRVGEYTSDHALVTRAVCAIVGSIWRKLGCDEKRLKLHTVGFGRDDFSVLRAMAECLPKGVGHFHDAKLSGEELLETFTTVSTTVTSTRQTSTGGGPRVLRPVSEEDADAAVLRYDVYQSQMWKVPDEWWAKVKQGQLSKKKYDRLMDLGERAIAVASHNFGSGGERNVFRLRMGKEVKDLSRIAWSGSTNRPASSKGRLPRPRSSASERPGSHALDRCARAHA